MKLVIELQNDQKITIHQAQDFSIEILYFWVKQVTEKLGEKAGYTKYAKKLDLLEYIYVFRVTLISNKTFR